PAILVLRDARRGLLLDQPLDRAERAVQGGEEEGVLDAAAGAEENLERRFRFAWLERHHGEFARILSSLAESIGDLGVEERRVGRGARDHAKLLRLTTEELHARCSGSFRYRSSLAGTPATIASRGTRCVPTASPPTTVP